MKDKTWTIKDLEYWDAKIRDKVEEYGLSCFPQEFEVCDHDQMLGFMAYHGMPGHYPHWSYGKSFEKLKTMYSYGVSGLPYEMVINANPALAYLMQDNSLCLQVLTIAHVYGHNDFFKNNFTFRDTHPENTIANAKLRADRVRNYMEDSSIGLHQVEQTLDAAHALAMQCRRNTAVRKLSTEEQKQRAIEDAQPRHDPYQRIHRPEPPEIPDINKSPIEPEEDILLFIADNNPYMSEWQRDLLHIVHEETQYFIPQMETKIMNEGWASYWHHKIMNSIDLPEDMYLEFLVHHNQVIRPHPGSLNPYHLGFKLWHDIQRRYSDNGPPEDDDFITELAAPHPDDSGVKKIFEVRETDRDVSFLRRFLTKEMMRELDLFEYQREEDKYVVSQVSDDEHWEQIKQTLLRSIGMGNVPVIRITDADYMHNRVLYLTHEHDGRDLKMEYLEKTLGYVYQLWGRQILLRTAINGKQVLFSYDNDGLSQFKK